MTPTARTLAHLRAGGYYAEVVERWIPRINIRRDLFGWADIVACHPERYGAVLIQVTTGDHFSERLAKARGNSALIAWRIAGNMLVLHGWRKLQGQWTLREMYLTMNDLVDGADRPT